MKHHGGFEHNLQSLRVVDELEQHYAAFDGLNLTFETREGILKHCSLHNARQLGEIGVRFLEKKQPSLEAQLANLADEIAYNNHDIDDGLRSGLLTMELMSEVDFFARHLREVEQAYPGITGRRVIHETVRRMINALIVDLNQTSRSRIAEIAPRDIEDVRNAPQLIAFSDAMAAEAAELKKFLREKLYRHYQVNRMTAKARRIIAEMFQAFIGQPSLLPPDYQVKGITDETQRLDKQARKVADYIAGMTDRYAIREHRRLFVME